MSPRTIGIVIIINLLRKATVRIMNPNTIFDIPDVTPVGNVRAMIHSARKYAS